MTEAPEIVSPFQRKYAGGEEDFVKSPTINIRMNQEEREMLHQLKGLLNTNLDGAALKIAARIGLNVLQGTIGSDITRWFTSDSRVKREKRHRNR